eukprot:8992721-Pyramimonas_sp.AAC.1
MGHPLAPSRHAVQARVAAHFPAPSRIRRCTRASSGHLSGELLPDAPDVNRGAQRRPHRLKLDRGAGRSGRAMHRADLAHAGQEAFRRDEEIRSAPKPEAHADTIE